MELIIYLVLLIGAVVGFYQGAFKQVANFLGVALGLIIAASLYEKFGDFLADKSGTASSFAHVLAFAVIVILVPIVLGWIAAFLTELFKKLKLNFLNRMLGAFIGVVSYALIMSVAFNLLDFVASNAGFRQQKLDERPQLYYAFKHATQVVIPDMVIVTDSTEVANGAEPKCGLKDVVNKAVDKINPLDNLSEE